MTQTPGFLLGDGRETLAAANLIPKIAGVTRFTPQPFLYQSSRLASTIYRPELPHHDNKKPGFESDDQAICGTL